MITTTEGIQLLEANGWVKKLSDPSELNKVAGGKTWAARAEGGKVYFSVIGERGTKVIAYEREQLIKELDLIY